MRWRSDRVAETTSSSSPPSNHSREPTDCDDDNNMKHHPQQQPATTTTSRSNSLDCGSGSGYDEVETSSMHPLADQDGDVRERLESPTSSATSSSSSSSSAGCSERSAPDFPADKSVDGGGMHVNGACAQQHDLDDDDDDDGDKSGGSSTSTKTASPQRSLDPPWGKESPGIIEDDDGADYAEDPPATWKPQNVQSTCEFTHTIQDYAQKRESGCKKAEYSETTVDEFGNRWRLIVYVNGNGRASNHHLSLFLQVADADSLPFGWKKSVSYVLTLEHPNGGSLSYAKRNPDKTFKLCPKAIDLGWSQFITSDRIQQEGFVANDSLTVRASVTVKSSSVKIDEEDAELYLKCAAEEGEAEAVKLCLDQGACVNCKFTDDLYTPLHTACSWGTSPGSMEVLNLLLERGADGNACNKWRETPLLIAANNGHRAAVQALLKHGADPSMCSEAGWSALTFAAHKGYDDIVALLLRAGAPVSCPVTEDSSTPLHKACAGSKSGHLACVKLLLEGGVDVHALNKWRETPLLTAANHGQAGAVEALLSAGADPCKCTDTGWSPLSIAAYKGHDEVVRLLLEEGAPTEEDDPTLSALLQAATKGLPETVELLLRHGADHTVTTKKGDTALSILVEQNLIDAAVEMVTRYGASIPRCSRDRKKVQRARLLINLRMKQLGREGKNATLSTDEESDADGDDSSSSKNAQSEDNGEFTGEAVKVGESKGMKGKMSAEEKAKAAEEALLLELEQEAAEAKKVEAEANTKRAKKRKKRERERQQRLKEEQERREREEREAEEREKLRREKEEKIRKERELRLQIEREREIKEMMEREKVLAAKRKEREEREKREKEQKARDMLTQRVAAGSVSPSCASTSDKQVGPQPLEKRSTAMKTKKLNVTNGAYVLSPKGVKKNEVQVPGLGGNRRWETTSKGKPLVRPQTKRQIAPMESEQSQRLPLPGRDSSPSIQSPRVATGVETSSFRPVETKSSAESAQQVTITNGTNGEGMRSHFVSKVVEHPAVALYRRERLVELVQRCLQVCNVLNEPMIKRVLYLWIVRAAHGPSDFLDPVIPSWKEAGQLVAFFQRQFIAESRKGSQTSSVPNMEALKEAGSVFAAFCQNAAKEVAEFRLRIAGHITGEWTDTAVGLTLSDAALGVGGAVVLSWANRSQVSIPQDMFNSLRERHVGTPSRFLAAIFVTKTLYDTMRWVISGTMMDCRLSSDTLACLSAEADISAQLWSNPFDVYSNNAFWGTFHEADVLFGGQKPFGTDERGSEEVVARYGGSLCVFPPMDSMVASRYVQRMISILDLASASNVPVSFIVFLHKECFRDIRNGPFESNLDLLEPRLSDVKRSYVRRVEVLAEGRHGYYSGEGSGTLTTCPSPSLLVLLQNDAGNSRFALSDASVAAIMGSMSVRLPAHRDVPAIAPIGLNEDFHVSDSISLYPVYFDAQRTFGSDSRPQPTSSLSPGDQIPRGSRRHDLFDLVDNGEEDPLNDVDIVSGMLNNLEVGLFRTNNTGHDVDIEAISLMGIGGPPPPPPQVLHPRSSQPGTFG